MRVPLVQQVVDSIKCQLYAAIRIWFKIPELNPKTVANKLVTQTRSSSYHKKYFRLWPI